MTAAINLLRAGLLSDEAATAAFNAWQSAVDIDTLPPAQNTLLPILARNLERLNIDHPWLPRLKGIYRRTWYANQVALRTQADVITALNAANLPALVIGAAALASTAYPELAQRPIHAGEIVVPPDTVDETIGTLNNMGWRAEPASPRQGNPSFRTWAAGLRFVNGQKQVLWLRWHGIPDIPCAHLDADFWTNAIPFDLESASAHTLSPTHHLLRSCQTAGTHNLIPLADAAMLIRQGEIDWSTLVRLATTYELTLPVHATLKILADSLGLPIPNHVLPTLAEVNPGWLNRQAQRATWTDPTSRAILDRVGIHLARFRRMAYGHNIIPGPQQLLAYLRANRPNARFL